jgi:hypothetical protein
MSLKNTIKKALGIAALAGTLMFPSANASGGDFAIKNGSPSSGFNKEYVDFADDAGSDGNHPPLSSPRLNTYCLKGTNKFTLIKMDLSTNSTYACPLQYDGAASYFNGASNDVAFRFNSAYPSNVLVTYKVDANGKLRPGDARKKIVESSNGWGIEWLDNISNAVNGQVYGTNFVNIAPIETTVKKLNYDAGANECALEADVRPGTISWPEFSDNLTEGSWTGLTNYPNRKYADVTTNNFGGLARVVWESLPAGDNGTRFWRIKNAVYDPAYTNGLVQDGGYEETNTLASVKSMQSARDSKKSERAIRFK